MPRHFKAALAAAFQSSVGCRNAQTTFVYRCFQQKRHRGNVCFSRERLRRVPFKKSPVIFVFQSSSSHHHHHHLIIIIISSSSHHHHLLIIISPSSSSSFPSLSPAFLFFSSFPSLSPAFLFFSNLAQPSSHEKRARCNPSQGKCVSSVKN